LFNHLPAVLVVIDEQDLHASNRRGWLRRRTGGNSRHLQIGVCRIILRGQPDLEAGALASPSSTARTLPP